MKRSALFLAVVCAAFCGFSANALATPATFTVDSLLDQSDSTDDGLCKTAVNTCTLRAALEQINAGSNSGPFTVNFTSLVQNNTIATTGGNLSVQSGKPTTIDGCSGVISPSGPCVAVTSDGTVLTLAAPSTITGLKLSGTGTPGSLITFALSSPGSTLTNSWIGLKADGTANTGVATTGVNVLSNTVKIGGTTAATRNVISGSGTGVRVNGADFTTISGNYFSTNSLGAAAAGTPNGTNIEVGSAESDIVAEHTVIGGTLDSASQATAACDGACNLISNATSMGIDLNGPGAFRAGNTNIAGNYVGTTLDGTSEMSNNGTAIRVGQAYSVVVGGPSVGDRNVVAGSGANPDYVGISQSGVGALTIENNYVGLNAAGNAKLNFENNAIAVTGDAVNPVVVQDNRIAHANGTGSGLELSGTGAQVIRNTIGIGTGGEALTGTGMRITGNQSFVVDNVFGNTTSNLVQSIYVDGGDGNVFKGNRFGVAANGDPAGPIYGAILIENSSGGNTANDNTVGGILPGDGNIIENTVHDAITIPTTGTGNKFVDSTGSNIGEQFIDVGGNGGTPNRDADGDGPGVNGNGANGSVAPPAVTSADSSSATGAAGANNGSTIRVFQSTTASGQPTQISASLQSGPITSGAWSVTFAPILDTTNVAAVTTEVDGSTSEFSDVADVADDNVPPDTTINSGPAGPIASGGAAQFTFTSEPNATFECAVDGAPFTTCASPFTSAVLAVGSHSFAVRAIDINGNVDLSPANATFTVAPPNVPAIVAPKILSAKVKGKATIKKGATLAVSVDKASTLSVKLTQKTKKGKKTKTKTKTVSLGSLSAGANTKKLSLKGFKPGKISAVLNAADRGVASSKTLSIKAKKK